MISQLDLVLADTTTDDSSVLLQKFKLATSCANNGEMTNNHSDSLEVSLRGSENITSLRRRRGRPANGSRTAEQRRHSGILKQRHDDDGAEVCSHISPLVTSQLPAEADGKLSRADNKFESLERSFEQSPVSLFSSKRSANLDYDDAAAAADNKQSAPNTNNNRQTNRISPPINHSNLYYNIKQRIESEPMKQHCKISSCTLSPAMMMMMRSREPLLLALNKRTINSTNSTIVKSPKSRFTIKCFHNTSNRAAMVLHLMMLLTSITLLAFNIGQIDCLRRNDHWTGKYNYN